MVRLWVRNQHYQRTESWQWERSSCAIVSLARESL